MRRRSFGPCAWLIDDVEDPAAWAEALRAARHPGIVEIVPAHDTVIVTCDRSRHEEVGTAVAAVEATSTAGADELPLIIDVRYDGEDVAEVAQAVGLSTENVIDLHLNSTFRVAFCGFSPGFGYLTGLPDRLHLPRRSDPRTAVPAGSVAIAGEYSCVYPSRSPGGWHLLGTTDAVLWDVAAEPPALLHPGRVVRFRQVTT